MNKSRKSEYYSAYELKKIKQQPIIKKEKYKTKVQVVNQDVVNFLRTLDKNDKIMVLNFASARNPGGGFLVGSSAQEESLCRASDLYLYIKDVNEFYKNQKHYESGLYDSDLIYSENVSFFKDGKGQNVQSIDVDVVTACAVNVKSLRQQDRRQELKLVESSMRERIENIFEIAMRKNVDTLVLGAFGCGVFSNNPYMIRNIFQDAIHSTRYKNKFKEIHFVIYKDDYLLNVFKNTL